MDRSRYDSLSGRERECLRLVAQGLETKRIAAELGPSPATIDGYIKSAMAKLGLSSRKEAARALAAFEGTTPQWLGGLPAGLDGASAQGAGAATSTDSGGNFLPLPFRRPGEARNELGIGWRLFWILAIAVGLAVGFGMLASGLKVVADLIGSRALLTH